jgi:hypothetical protein
MGNFCSLPNKWLWQLKACTKHDIHPPFIYDFVEQIIDDCTLHPIFKDLDLVQISILQHYTNQQKDHYIYKANVYKQYNELLFKVVHYFKPQSILELGTGVGVRTVYLSEADKTIPITSYDTLTPLLPSLGINVKFKLCSGWNQSLFETQNWDFILINKHFNIHIDSIKTIVEHLNPDSILIFDHPNLDCNRYHLWQSIIHHPQISTSITLFHLGIAFTKIGATPEHFNVRFPS